MNHESNERAYVGKVVDYYRVGLDAHPLVDPRMLRSPTCEAVLSAARELREVGDHVNELAIMDRLKATGRHVGDEEVFAICDASDDNVSLPQRARAIVAEHELRKMRDRSLLIADAVKRGDVGKVRELAADIVAEQQETRPYTIRTAYESAESAMQMLVDSLDNAKSRVRMDDAELAEGVGTLGPGTLTVIGAGTGVGKSTLALYLARCVRPAVGIVSLEDPPEVYGARILSPLAGVSSSAIFTGNIGDFETMNALGNGLNRVGKQPMIAYAIGAPIVDVLSAIRTLATKHQCKLIVVDYVQAVRFDVRADRRIAIADAVSQMKSTAAKVGAALVICSQLSRPPSDSKFREPMTHHLKESGDIENMAEAIVMLWNTSDKPGSNVYGKVAKLKWGYAGHRFRFERDHIGNLKQCVPWDGVDIDNPPSRSTGDYNGQHRPAKAWT